MKKLLAFLVALCLLAALCGCKEQKHENGESGNGGRPGTSQGGADADEETYKPNKTPVGVYNDGSN